MWCFCILNALLCPYLLALVQKAFSGGHHHIFKICTPWESPQVKASSLIPMICDTRKQLCVMMCCNGKSSQKAKLCLFISVALSLDESWAFHKSAVQCLWSWEQQQQWLPGPSQAASAHPAATTGRVTQGCSRTSKGSTTCPPCAWAVQCAMGFSCVLFFYVITKSSFVFLFSNKKKNPLVSLGCEEGSVCSVLWTSAKLGNWAKQINWILGLMTVRPVKPNICKWCVTLISALKHCTQIYFS